LEKADESVVHDRQKPLDGLKLALAESTNRQGNISSGNRKSILYTGPLRQRHVWFDSDPNMIQSIPHRLDDLYANISNCVKLSVGGKVVILGILMLPLPGRDHVNRIKTSRFGVILPDDSNGSVFPVRNIDCLRATTMELTPSSTVYPTLVLADWKVVHGKLFPGVILNLPKLNLPSSSGALPPDAYWGPCLLKWQPDDEPSKEELKQHYAPCPTFTKIGDGIVDHGNDKIGHGTLVSVTLAKASKPNCPPRQYIALLLGHSSLGDS
jgi:hypothetical protein